jgi:hypothetical protein
MSTPQPGRKPAPRRPSPRPSTRPRPVHTPAAPILGRAADDPDITIDLHILEVEDVVHLLCGLVDWLRHASYDTYEDISTFYGKSGDGRMAVRGLISLLEDHADTLRYRIKEATR